MNLNDIIEQAIITPDKVLSRALNPDQHICAHGNGEILVWDFNFTWKTFARCAYKFEEFSTEQFDTIRSLMRKCDEMWRDNLLESIGDRKPKKELVFKYVGINPCETWRADCGKGEITLRKGEFGTQFSANFGPNSDKSFSGYLPACDLDLAKRVVWAQIPGLPRDYR